MKKSWLSRLNAIVLAVALLLPCVMTVPAMAAEGDSEVLYSWTPSGTAYDCAQEMVNNSVPRTDYKAIPSPTEENYGEYSNILFSAIMNTAEGSRTQRFLSMFVGIDDDGRGGLESVEVAYEGNARRRTTESLKVTLAELEDTPVGTGSHGAIALTHLLAVRTTLIEEHGMIRDDDAVYTVHTTGNREWDVNGLRSWQLIGAGKLGTDDAVFYQVTSNDLLGDYTLAADEQIDRIDYYPYGLSTSMDRGGYFHLGDVQLLGYANQFAFEAEYADCHSDDSYIPVSGETLREIVVAEAEKVMTHTWTTPADEELIGRIVWGTDEEGNKVGTITKRYAANKERTGPIYQRGSTNTSDPLILLSTEAFQQMATDGEIVNRTFGGITAAPGMDCSTFVYNAISRVSTTMAYTNMFYERDNRLVRLGNLVATDDQPKFTDGDIINDTDKNTKEDVFTAYKELKKGDVLNTFGLNKEKVHAMLVYDTPDVGATSVEVIEQTGSVEGENTNSRTRTVFFEDLYDSKYLPYTLKEYGEGRVQKANVQLLVLPNDSDDWAKGVSTAAAASNYRIISMTATVTNDSSKEKVASFNEYGWRSRNEHQIMDVAELNDTLAGLEPGTYTLTVAVTSGPKTSLGGDTHVEPFTKTFTVAAHESDEHVTTEGAEALTSGMTTLTAGTTYYLTGNVTATDNLTVGVGDAVTLCLNDYILTAPASPSAPDSDKDGGFITVPAGATLYICGGAKGNGTIRGNTSANAAALRGIAVTGTEENPATLTLTSGTISGFKSSNRGAGVFVYGTSTFNMDGGSITGNTSANNGGGVFVSGTSSLKYGTFNMTGGTISGNVASGNGGGVCVNHGSAMCSMTNGTITANTADGLGGGFYTQQNVENLGGLKNMTITDNTSTAGKGDDIGYGFTTDKSGTATALAIGEDSVIGDVYLTNENKPENPVPNMTVENASVDSVSMYKVGNVAGGLLTITSGTFGFDPEDGAHAGWVKLADGTGVTEDGDPWEVGPVVNCGEHENGDKLTSYVLSNLNYTLSDGTYYLTRDIDATDNITVTGEVTLCLNDHAITAPPDGGSFITVESGAKLTLCGGTNDKGAICGHAAKPDARGVEVYGTMVMESGTISGFTFTSTGYGAGILLNSNSTFTMNGGTISGNAATNGGAIYLNANASCIIKDGVLSENNAADGGAIRTDVNCALNIQGGRFLNNSATRYGGAIRTGVAITITGGEFIGNSGGSSKQTFNFYAESLLSNVIIECPEGGTIGKNAKIVSGTVNVDPENDSDNDRLADGCTSEQVGEVWVVTLQTCPAHASGSSDLNTELSRYLNDTTGYYDLPAGTYYLSDDLPATNNITVTGKVTLCLNDHILTAPPTGGNFITVGAGASLTVCGGHEGKGIISGCGEDTVTNAIGIYAKGSDNDSNLAVVIIDSGTISGFKNSATDTYGAGVYVDTFSTLTMYGGAISRNEGYNGGGVALGNGFSAKVYLNGGEISGNKANAGGGVYQRRGEFIMNGGAIKNNTSTTTGGGVYAINNTSAGKNGSFLMNDGEISGNTATTNGGAIYHHGFGTVTIEGGVIKDNKAANGGAIWSDATNALTISGGTFTGNEASTYGGVVYVYKTATNATTISGGTFTANKATTSGGVAYYAGVEGVDKTGSFTVSGGLFKANKTTAGSGGGGVFYSNSAAPINITGGTYVENYAAWIGGFIRTGSAAAAVKITGGTYVNNTDGYTKNDVKTERTFYLGVAGTIADVDVVVAAGGLICNKDKAKVISGRFNVNPSDCVPTAGLYSVKPIDEIVTVDGESYTLAYEVVEGFAESGGYVDFRSSIDASILLVNPTVPIDTKDYTLTVTQTKWDAETGTKAVTPACEFTNIQIGGVDTLALVAHGIAAKEMRDQLTFTVTQGEGEEAVTYYSKTVSLYDIAKGWYDAETDGAAKKTMLADMLNYGAEAMKVFGYNETVLDSETALVGTTEEVSWERSANASVPKDYVNKVAYTLSLEDKIALNIYFEGTVTGETVEGTTATGSYTGQVSAITSGDKTISKVTFSDIEVVNAKEDVTFTVTLDGEEVTVIYSIKDYVVSMLGGKQDDVLRALQKYVESVTNYINTINS